MGICSTYTILISDAFIYFKAIDVANRSKRLSIIKLLSTVNMGLTSLETSVLNVKLQNRNKCLWFVLSAVLQTPRPLTVCTNFQRLTSLSWFPAEIPQALNCRTKRHQISTDDLFKWDRIVESWLFPVCLYIYNKEWVSLLFVNHI